KGLNISSRPEAHYRDLHSRPLSVGLEALTSQSSVPRSQPIVQGDVAPGRGGLSPPLGVPAPLLRLRLRRNTIELLRRACAYPYAMHGPRTSDGEFRDPCSGV